MTDAATAGAWVRSAAGRLAAADRAGRPAAEARALLAAALELAPERLFAHPETPVDDPARARADALLARRLRGEPLARIVGVREFWSLPFELAPDALDPRADTETLVETALGICGDDGPTRILDLGVGSGCILLALLSEWPTAAGVGLDRAPRAVALARRNAARLGLADRAGFLVGDWSAALAPGAFDLIVANPPYIATAGDGLRPDAATTGYDPPLALWGGPDGLDAYRAILPDLARLLRSDGAAAIEVGADQAAAVTELAATAGLAPIVQARDLAGHVRCLAFRVRRSGPDA